MAVPEFRISKEPEMIQNNQNDADQIIKTMAAFCRDSDKMNKDYRLRNPIPIGRGRN